MSINSISFKGAMIVKGEQNQLLEISRRISDNSGATNSKYTNGKAPRFSYESLPLNGGGNQASTEVLYTTKKDVQKISRSATEIVKLGKENLSKHFKGIKTFTAEEIVTAISGGKFDFKRLLVRK